MQMMDSGGFVRVIDLETTGQGLADGGVVEIGGVVQSEVTRGAWQSRVDASRTDDGTLTFSGAVQDGSMCWRSGEAARE